MIKLNQYKEGPESLQILKEHAADIVKNLPSICVSNPERKTALKSGILYALNHGDVYLDEDLFFGKRADQFVIDTNANGVKDNGDVIVGLDAVDYFTESKLETYPNILVRVIDNEGNVCSPKPSNVSTALSSNPEIKQAFLGPEGGALLYLLTEGSVGIVGTSALTAIGLSTALVFALPSPPPSVFEFPVSRGDRQSNRKVDAFWSVMSFHDLDKTLQQHLKVHPEDWGYVENILNASSEEQVRVIQLVLKPGEKVRIEIEVTANVQAEEMPQLEVVTLIDDQAKKKSSCPPDMVYVPEGTYEGKNYPAICVDEHEYTDPGSLMPKNDVKLAEATALCDVQQKRLPTSLEWVRIASQNGTKIYSTRSGLVDDGVHYRASGPREACAARGKYIEYEGREVCDMSGNMAEWTQDSFLVGGSWYNTSISYVRVDFRINDLILPGKSDADIGFRCVKSPEAFAK